MSAITWDKVGERIYQTGVDRGVFYTEAGGEFISGVPWNGLTSIEPSREGRDLTSLYSADVKRDTASTFEEYGGSITAYTYPEEVALATGAVDVVPGVRTYQQNARRFGLCYRTVVANDIYGTDYAYRLHLIYNGQFTSISDTSSTITDSAGSYDLTWDYITIPMEYGTLVPFSEVVIDSRSIPAEVLSIIETILYGSETDDPRLPLLEEIVGIYDAYTRTAVDTDDFEWYPNNNIYPSYTKYPMDVEAVINSEWATKEYVRGAAIAVLKRLVENSGSGETIPEPIVNKLSMNYAPEEYVRDTATTVVSDLGDGE
jgi:hypothetical protein